ncbi:helix-turn-helix domain-containing protein [Desulfitobacterium chlororespirans]|uniref:Putative transcriptional regulator n=1 Tax=Desulfitobacterium chlororespirans DSM 11544 TaxID=1121395 RepID=A0A1M7UUH2_9FIRM|nr:helix-turn-helix transcriptional regulator [Desulfitobacterium chlororespirans]SHN86594.1 putative transcriptional regulator [Desulfitobacterium chlororespirans DSM 11544]
MQDITDYGRVEIILGDYLKTNKISKNFLAEKANLQRTQLNTYCKNNIKRVDFDVLARICYALNCELADIVSYVKPQNENGGERNG